MGSFKQSNEVLASKPAPLHPNEKRYWNPSLIKYAVAWDVMKVAKTVMDAAPGSLVDAKPT